MTRLKNYKNKYHIYYHIFSDNIDFYEDNLKKANNKFNNLKKQGQKNIRLYQCWFGSLEDAVNAENGNYSYDNEYSDCLRFLGEFPM